MRDSPFGQYESASTGTMEEFDAEALIADYLPELDDAVWAVTQEQIALVPQILTDTATHESVRLLLNLAFNDFRDLLHDLQRGSGRSAIRAARSVIEHAINMHTVVGGLEAASLYAEHLDQGAALANDMQVGASRLSKKDRKAYLHSLKRVGGEAHSRFEASVREHGPWFRRGWSQTNISDRADAAGLSDLYRYYKLASLVTHGSAGGSLGSMRDDAKGVRTFRTGPALELAPVAMWVGLAGYRAVLSGLAAVRQDIRIDTYTAGLDLLDNLWADYFKVLRDLDKQLWPDGRVPAPMSVLAFTRSGLRRWYLHLPQFAVLLPAHEPELPDWIEQQLTELVELATTEHTDQWNESQRWVTAAVLHVSLTPDMTRPAIPEKALMQQLPPDGGEFRTSRLPSARDSH